jgi:hypothetical protein
MVHQPGFTGSGGSFGEGAVAREHVDERAFAHIRAADEGEFGQAGLRALIHPGAASCECRLFDLHDLQSYKQTQRKTNLFI